MKKKKLTLDEAILRSLRVYVEVEFKLGDDVDKLTKALKKIYKKIKDAGVETDIHAVNGAFSKETSYDIACMAGELMSYIARRTGRMIESTTLILPDQGDPNLWAFFFSQAFRDKNSLIVFHKKDLEKLDVTSLLSVIDKMVPTGFVGVVIVK